MDAVRSGPIGQLFRPDNFQFGELPGGRLSCRILELGTAGCVGKFRICMGLTGTSGGRYDMEKRSITVWDVMRLEYNELRHRRVTTHSQRVSTS